MARQWRCAQSRCLSGTMRTLVARGAPEPRTRCPNEAVTKRAMGKPTPAYTGTAVVIVIITIYRAFQNNTLLRKLPT